MNQEQREFLVTRVDKYNQEIDKLNNYITANVFLAGVTSVMLLALTPLNSNNVIGALMEGGILLFNSILSITCIKNIITSIAIKVGLSNKINDIEDQLGLNTLDTEKGMRR